MIDAIGSHPYEAPRIEQRTPLDVPLIGNSSNIDGGPSAAFRAI